LKYKSWDRRNNKIRNINIREEIPKILIICQGEKTEANYFTDFKNDLKRTSVKVKIETAPLSPQQ
jgi:hypothetical protein